MNLIDTPFLESGGKLITLLEAFEPERPNLTGDPQQRIIGLKLLLAVAQSALPVRRSREFSALTNAILSSAAMLYLKTRRDRFNIDDKVEPFLQFPKAKEIKPFAPLSVLPDMLGGVNTPYIASTSSVDRELTDSERIWTVLFAVIMPAGGRKWAKAFSLGTGKAEVRTCTPAASLGIAGLVHTFIEGETLLDTIRLNLLAEEDLLGKAQYTSGIGTAPWDERLQFETQAGCEAYRYSLMGRLIPMSRFVLLDEEGLHGGLGVDDVPLGTEGGADPSVAARPKADGRGFTADMCDRTETDAVYALRSLGYFRTTDGSSFNGPKSLIAEKCLPRARKDPAFVGIWSGGRSVSFRSGEQVATFTDRVRSVTLDLRASDEALLAKANAVAEANRRFIRAVERHAEALGAAEASVKGMVTRGREAMRPTVDRLAETFFRAKTREAEEAAFAQYTGYLKTLFRTLTPYSGGRSIYSRASLGPYFGDLYTQKAEETGTNDEA